MAWIWVAIGIVLLFFGGEILIRAAAQLARGLGMSPLVIGLTVVAFATSSPELVASIVAALRGQTELAIGNVIGSNIVNISFFLGLSALFTPLVVTANFLRREAIVLLISSGFLVPPLAYGGIGRIGGALFLVALAAYTVYLIRTPEKGEVVEEFQEEFGKKKVAPLAALTGVVIGVLLLTGGAHSLVTGAVDLARELGLTEQVIGLTIVAIGTGLPELASCLVGVRRGETDLVVGNLVGSNIFNCWGVLGVTALIRPLDIDEGAITNDVAAMMAFSVAAMVMLFRGQKLSRAEGGVLVVAYVYYLIAILS